MDRGPAFSAAPRRCAPRLRRLGFSERLQTALDELAASRCRLADLDAHAAVGHCDDLNVGYRLVECELDFESVVEDVLNLCAPGISIGRHTASRKPEGVDDVIEEEHRLIGWDSRVGALGVDRLLQPMHQLPLARNPVRAGLAQMFLGKLADSQLVSKLPLRMGVCPDPREQVIGASLDFAYQRTRLSARRRCLLLIEVAPR